METPITILVVCTGNICRSPMAAALLAARLAEAGVDAVVSSAGIMAPGRAAPDHAVAVMAARGFDTSAHRSRLVDADLLHQAGVVVTMTRQHVRDVVASAPEAWPKTFTIRELVRLGERHGPRRSGEPVREWIAALHAGRRPADHLGASAGDDVADPYGGPRRVYEELAGTLDDLTRRLARLLAPAATRSRDERPAS